VTIARFALVTVSSSRTTTWPALTRSPSRASTSPTTPPVGCCTFFTLDSTTICPARSARPRSPPSRPAAEAAGQNHDDGKADDQMHADRPQRALLLAAAHDLETPPSETILIGLGGVTAAAPAPARFPWTEGLHAAVFQDQELVDALDADRPMRDHHHDGAALARGADARVSASSPRCRDWSSARRARSGTDCRTAPAPAPRAAPGRPRARCPARRSGCRSPRAS